MSETPVTSTHEYLHFGVSAAVMQVTKLQRFTPEPASESGDEMRQLCELPHKLSRKCAGNTEVCGQK